MGWKDGWNEVRRDGKIGRIYGGGDGQALRVCESEQSQSLILTKYLWPTADVLDECACVYSSNVLK